MGRLFHVGASGVWVQRLHQSCHHRCCQNQSREEIVMKLARADQFKFIATSQKPAIEAVSENDLEKVMGNASLH
jgi:hypothetical protein